MSVLIIDNYDSFTYNLFHYCKLYREEVTVKRNDEIELSEIESFEHILLSPGPGLPDEAGIMPMLIEHFHAHKNILGVCLGAQGIAEYFGANLLNLPTVLHGKQSLCHLTDPYHTIFKNVPSQFKIGHYHSWVIDENNFPADLRVSSRNDDGLIMSIYHPKYKLHGVQFHPESILTEYGREMIGNWLRLET